MPSPFCLSEKMTLAGNPHVATSSVDTGIITNDDKDKDVSLVLFGYSLKESTSERRSALEAAVKARGAPAVISRLEFLQQAWCGTKKFVDSIDQDMGYVRRLGQAPEYQFVGDNI